MKENALVSYTTNQFPICKHWNEELSQKVALNICIVGYGNIGKLHHNKLMNLGATIYIVDPSIKSSLEERHYSHLLELGEKIDQIDIFNICVPNQFHKEVVWQIFSMKKSAKMILEKPLGNLDYFAKLPLHLTNHIFINSPYRFSQPLLLAIEHFKKINQKERLKHIIIEFSKNREADERSGRFIDTEIGALGYELFHMLEILCCFLSPGEQNGFLSTKNISSLSSKFDGPNLASFKIEGYAAQAQIHLYSSMRGEIGYPFDRYLKATGISERGIPYGDSARYRMVCLIFETQKIWILYDPYYKSVDTTKKNQHWVIVEKDNVCDLLEVCSDHLNDSIAFGVKKLSGQINEAHNKHPFHQYIKFQQFAELIYNKIKSVI